MSSEEHPTPQEIDAEIEATKKAIEDDNRKLAEVAAAKKKRSKPKR